MPDSERERRLDEIYSAALKQDASGRGEFVRQACRGDMALRQEIESLLGDEPNVGDFLQKAALEATGLGMAGGQSRSLVGQTLGPYDVLSLLGTGGMGEVYSARDTRLGRVVALKTLHPEVAADPDRKRRLLLEARAASALNDPHIVALYDVSSADGIDFLVMEYVEGQTLDKLIPPGGMEIRQALAYAIEIAAGLERAHEAGIVHRDLKPGNIMISGKGAVKVLDFGLAKLTEGPQAGAGEGAGSLVSMVGVILGTAAYMSPELAQGQTVDARSDIFSFGVVLYEMLTGQRPFQGSDRTSTLGAIVREEPRPLTDMNAAIPAELGRLVLRCLRKNPKERFQNMADVKATLEALQAVKAAARRRRWIGVAAAIVMILIPSLAAYRWKHPAARSLTERQLTANAQEDWVTSAALSPDGKYLAYGDEKGLFLRSLDSGEDRPVRVPEELAHRRLETLQWFPDGGKLLADPYNENAIWAIPMRGDAPPRMIYHGQEPVIAPDGRSIAFIDNARRELWVGGVNRESPRRLHAQEEKDSFFHPAWSPDGRWIAYWNVKGWPRSVTIEVRPAGGGPAKTLAPGSGLPTTTWMGGSMVWSPDWRLVFSLNEVHLGLARDYDNDGIWDLRVEPTRCEALGKPERLTPRLGWHFQDFTITADGKRLAYVKARTQFNVWVGGLDGGRSSMTAPRRLTFDTRARGSEIDGWSLDSQDIIFSSRRNGKNEVFRQGLTETVPKKFVEGSESVCCPVLTPDGSWLLYWEAAAGGRLIQRLMRRAAAGGSPEMVLEAPVSHAADFDCPVTPGYPCEFSQREGQDLVFYWFDPVRGKGDRIGKIETKTRLHVGPGIDWTPSRDGSRLGVVDGQSRIAVLTLADRASHEIPIPAHWGGLNSIGKAADGKGFIVVAASLEADYILNVTAAGKVELLFRQDSSERRIRNLAASPDGKHLAFSTSGSDSNVWMMENF